MFVGEGDDAAAGFLLSRLRFWRIGCLSGAVQLGLG